MYALIFIYSAHRLLPCLPSPYCIDAATSPRWWCHRLSGARASSPKTPRQQSHFDRFASQSSGQGGHLPSSVLKKSPVRAEKTSRGEGGRCSGRQISSLTSSSPSRFHEEERLVTDLEESGGSGGIHRVWMWNLQARQTRSVPGSCLEVRRLRFSFFCVSSIVNDLLVKHFEWHGPSLLGVKSLGSEWA